MTKNLQVNSVQNTLCIPLWGRMLATKKYPEVFPDYDAERIIRDIGCDMSGNKLYKMEYTYLNCMVRQYDMSWEINHYLYSHPKAVVAELGAGLSTLRSQMKNETNPWYNLDMEDVIKLREQYLHKAANEHNVICDLNDFAWFDAIDFNPDNGIVFVAGGLFYYFEKWQVKKLFTAMAGHFPGGVIAFDATNAMGLKGVNKQVKMAGNETKSFFSLENPKAELESWSSDIVNVSEKDYMRGYLLSTAKFSLLTQIIMRGAALTHTSFIVHAEFKSCE